VVYMTQRYNFFFDMTNISIKTIQKKSAAGFFSAALLL